MPYSSAGPFQMHIFIISYDWPPRNAISVHRPYSWARYWVEMGMRVTVLTARKRSFDEPLDLVLPELSPSVRIIEVPYGSTIEGPYSVLKSVVLRTLARRTKALLFRILNIYIDPRQPWFKEALPYALSWADEVGCVVSTYPTASAHLLAYEMKQANPKLRWIADYRDLWSQSQYYRNSEKTFLRMSRLEANTVGHAADIITTVSEDFKTQLENFLLKRVIVNANGFDHDEQEVRSTLSNIKRNSYKHDFEPFRIVYTGTVYSNRDPTPLFDAINDLLRTGEIRNGSVTVDFYGERLGEVIKLSRRKDYSSFIRIMGHVSREVALDAQRRAGALLLMEGSDESDRGVLTGKIFEYLVAGRPIICIGSSINFEIGQVLKKSRTGLVVEKNNLDKLPIFLIDLIRNPTGVDWFSPDIPEIINYSRRRLAIQYLFQVVSS
jgi:hypothetical protein